MLEIEISKEMIIMMNHGLYAGPGGSEEWTRTGGINGLEVLLRLNNYSKWDPSTRN